MSLKSRIAERIRLEGPMSIAEYMTLCLLDPVDGYYPTRDPLGSEGDFITAPEISQMFGELLGLWVLQSWRDLGAPSPIQLIELGPGRGVMMSDMLRTLALDPAFLGAAQIHLVEASPALQAVQGQSLSASPIPVLWHNNLTDIPPGSSLILGNEFLDCLPIRQFVSRSGTWRERVITWQGGDLAFAQSTGSVPDITIEAEEGDLLEVCPAMPQLIDTLASRFTAYPGRALFLDYGPTKTEFGDTLQALKRHQKVDPLDDPGNADLTARVDFEALTNAAIQAGLAVSGPAIQAAFLSRLGLEVRASALVRANPNSKDTIARQLHRLTAKDEMGQLFKAISISSPNLPQPLGFT